MSAELVKVQLVAEFVLPDGEFKQPGVYGPVTMTAREWSEFDLQAAIEEGVREQEPQPKRPRRAASSAP